MTEQVYNNIYSIPVVLPDSPLKWLNSYYIPAADGGRALLVDTGFNRPECYDALLRGFAELGVEPENTDVFITHLHSDHAGNAPKLEALGCRVIMGALDYSLMGGDNWSRMRERALREGMSGEVAELVFSNNPATKYRPERFCAETVEDGDVLHRGGFGFECICTPGHTPGHMCLYDREKRLFLSGDHVLFDISPNITCWSTMRDPLGSYIESLRRVEELEVETALPSHRNCGSVTLAQRAADLIEHHARRLAELEELIRSRPGLTAYELTGLLKWRIRARNWDEFPPAQKWFAMGEAMAHLDYLRLRGRISADDSADQVVYFCNWR